MIDDTDQPRNPSHVLASSPKCRLCAWEIAKAIGFRGASKELHCGVPNMPWVAERVKKVVGGRPSRMSLHVKKIDADPDWFPRKLSEAKRGRKQIFTASKRRCVAQSVMSAKRRRAEEPCVGAVSHSCPAATQIPRPRSRSARRLYGVCSQPSDTISIPTTRGNPRTRCRKPSCQTK